MQALPSNSNCWSLNLLGMCPGVATIRSYGVLFQLNMFCCMTPDKGLATFWWDSNRCSVALETKQSYFTVWPHEESIIVFVTGPLHIYLSNIRKFFDAVLFKYIVHSLTLRKHPFQNPFPSALTKHPKLDFFL